MDSLEKVFQELDNIFKISEGSHQGWHYCFDLLDGSRFYLEIFYNQETLTIHICAHFNGAGKIIWEYKISGPNAPVYFGPWRLDEFVHLDENMADLKESLFKETLRKLVGLQITLLGDFLQKSVRKILSL